MNVAGSLDSGNKKYSESETFPSCVVKGND